VLYNWRRLDAEADICMENLSTLNNFFDGRDESWFYLITVEVEAKGAASVVPMMLAIDAIQRHNEEKEMQILRKERMRNRTESNMSFGSDKSQDSVEINQARRIVRIEREDSNWDVDDNFQRRLLSSALDAEQDGEVRVEEALIGELTAINVAVYVSLQLRKIAESIKVHH
jgi:Indoleamine 2,3-dioxygenase